MEARDVPSALSLRLWAHAHARPHVQAHPIRHVAPAPAILHPASSRPVVVPRVVVPSAHTAATLVTSHPQSVSSTVSLSSRPAAATAAPVSRPLNILVGTPVSNSNQTPSQTSATTTTTTDIGDVKNGPLAKAGPNLIALYVDFQKSGSSSQSATLQVVGNQVRIDVRGTGDVNSLASTLTSLGMQVENTDPNTRTVEGLLPISQLPQTAQLSEVTAINPVFRPRLR